jgi:cellulose synthase/poly-beta-1,6-N-acetylglucosamine synthase-like glycosyltransferase
VRRNCASAVSTSSGSIALIGPALRLAPLPVGLAAAKGEFLCILDADFVPEKDLLKRTVHFFTDPKVGMIQTRWGHLNRGLFSAHTDAGDLFGWTSFA